MLLNELLDGLYESPRHWLHSIGGKHFRLPLLPDEPQGPFPHLKPAHDHVQIHPVDAFHFQNRMLLQYFGHRHGAVRCQVGKSSVHALSCWQGLEIVSAVGISNQKSSPLEKTFLRHGF